MPDPEHRFDRVVLGQEVTRPRTGPAFDWSDGEWQVTFPRPDADRMEYLLGVDGAFVRTRRTGCVRRAPSVTSR